jgi:hypothetical protein
VHEKVANQSNSELPSSSPTWSPGPPRIQINVQIATSVLDVLHMHGKLRIYPFRWNQSNIQLKSESSAIIKTVPISRTIFGATPLFWPDGPCI